MESVKALLAHAHTAREHYHKTGDTRGKLEYHRISDEAMKLESKGFVSEKALATSMSSTASSIDKLLDRANAITINDEMSATEKQAAMLGIQTELNSLNQILNMVSNLIKATHETLMTPIRNLRV